MQNFGVSPGAADCFSSGNASAEPSPRATAPAYAATEFALSVLLTLYTIYIAIFWAFVLTLGCILARLFLF